LLPHMRAFGSMLRCLWTARRPEIVHAHYWMSGLACLEGVSALQIPFIQTFHALGVVKRRHLRHLDTSPPERIPTESRLARTADIVVATSAAEATELKRMSIPSQRIVVVPCGVDTEEFSPNGPSETRNPGLKRIVMVGRLVRRKGVDEVVHALTELPNVELVVVGGGSTFDPDVDRLRSLARRLRVEERVEFRGPMEHCDIPRVLRSADLVVCFPWYEPFGIVAIEAMACGRPLLVSSVGGLRETVLSGRNGVVVRPREVRSLATVANQLLQNSPRCLQISREGRQLAVRKYDWRHVVDKIMGAYQSALSRTDVSGLPLQGCS
jgi:glycosyltransferase involved in cell wall biosynthesis